MPSFNAFVVRQNDGQTSAKFETVTTEDLSPGDLLVRVEYSSLNYKDGLAVTLKPGVIRTYPMVPGVDFAGVVEESTNPEFPAGTAIVVTGCGTSETFWGGYSQYARIKSEYAVPLPKGWTSQEAMGVGTAGFTSMQSVMALEAHGVKPGGKPVVVTGAGGGVGSIAIAILAKLGYQAVASTGRAELSDYLKDLGAAEIIDRGVLSAPSKRPMDSEKWAGAIDSVGGETLAGLIRTMSVHGSIASCGVAGGPNVATTVFPFILRGVNLLGIDSVRVSNAERRAIWARLAIDLPLDKLNATIKVEPLAKIQELGAAILAGQTRGRTVIAVS